jgi:hypothetical protein
LAPATGTPSGKYFKNPRSPPFKWRV